MANPLYLSLVQYQEELDAGRMTPFDAAEQARALGLDGVELRREGWPACEREAERLSAFCAEKELGVTLAVYMSLLAANEREAARLEADIRLAGRLGASLLRVFPGALPPQGDAAWETARGFLDLAASLSLKVAVENPGGASRDTRRTMRRLLGTLTHPALRTNLDIGNYAVTGEDIPGAIAEFAPRIGGVHLKDIDGDGRDRPLGEGKLPLAALLTALSDAAPDAVWAFEFTGEGTRGLRRSVEYIKGWREKRCGSLS